jgi:hypothetical protein
MSENPKPLLPKIADILTTTMGICCSIIKLFLTPIPGRGILPGRFIANKLFLCKKHY